MLKNRMNTICAVAILSFLASAPSYAQTNTPEPPEDEPKDLETIVVTGSKRDTSLLDSDLSVTVLNATAIEDARLRDFRRIDDLAPNVQFNESGQRGSIFITVRGVESNPFIINRAAVYIDGIPFRELSNSVLSQIQSIEVLRGPQGTLYGANTESGLIIVNTKAPSDEFTGNIRLTGSHYSSGESFEGSGNIGGPLIPGKLNGSLSFNIAHEDAYVKNLGSTDGETGHIDETFIQGRLQWTPNDKLTVNTTAYWLKMKAPGIFDTEYVPLDIDLYNNSYADLYNGGTRISDFTIVNDAPKYSDEEEIVLGLSATYELGAGKIDIAASHRDLDENASGLDFDLTGAPFVSGQEIENEKYTHIEARYTSPTDQFFDYIVGTSYYEEEEIRTLASFIGAGTLASYIPAPPQQKNGKDISFFGSANLYASSKLRFGFGLRYDRAKRSTIQTAGDLDLGFGSVVSYPDANLSRTFDALLPRFSAHYSVSDQLSIHASMARGYIPGGFNLAAVQAGIDDENIIAYESERLWSRELGFKWQSEDARLRMAGAVFYITANNWQEIQIATDASGRPVSSDYIGSNSSIRSYGAEFEAHWQINDALVFDAHIGYVDSEYRNLQLASDLNVEGQSVQFVPEYDAGIAARYEWVNGFFARTEVGFTGKTPLRARGDIFQKAVTTLGFQIGYAQEKYAIRLFGENLTNVRRASGLAIENLAFGSDGNFYGPLDAPRVIGIELEMFF